MSSFLGLIGASFNHGLSMAQVNQKSSNEACRVRQLEHLLGTKRLFTDAPYNSLFNLEQLTFAIQSIRREACI
ncbi:MAG: hypothetical protein ACM65L_13875 [Microcoleus sp.]